MVQMPATSIEDMQHSIDWSSPEASEQVNRLFKKTALERLVVYQPDGNETLGVYNDKRDPTQVAR